MLRENEQRIFLGGNDLTARFHQREDLLRDHGYPNVELGRWMAEIGCYLVDSQRDPRIEFYAGVLFVQVIRVVFGSRMSPEVNRDLDQTILQLHGYVGKISPGVHMWPIGSEPENGLWLRVVPPDIVWFFGSFKEIEK